MSPRTLGFWGDLMGSGNIEEALLTGREQMKEERKRGRALWCTGRLLLPTRGAVGLSVLTGVFIGTL